MVSSPASEIEDFDAAAEWVGIPEYEKGEKPLQLIINFANAEDREKFAKLVGSPVTDKTKSIWFPHRDKDDESSLRLES